MDCSRCVCLLMPCLGLLLSAAEPASQVESPFDLQAIREDPLAAETTQIEQDDGVVIEHVVFNGDRDRDGAFIRLSGILAYPEGGKDLPGLLWCQGGMGDARPYFPVLFARKGYLCLHVTLAKETWGAYGKFDAADPAHANLLRFAVEQMRGVTCIANRPEVDADRLGVAGASYGGVFSTLVAGVDPRIKAGMSFFGAGNHYLGTNLPQFCKLESREEIDVFTRTVDGATYMREREVPFIWGLPTNDNWFFFPAVVETYRQKPGKKRIAILPHWVHGFPPTIDQQLYDWLDIYLKGTRAPYLQPGAMALQAKTEDGKATLQASWAWSGAPAAQRAELVVSYGRILPWHGWRHRYYHTIPATIAGQSARAAVPVPDPDLPMLVFGNVYDDRDVLVSTDPIEATPRALGIELATDRPRTVGCPRGRFEPEDTTILAGTAQGFGRVDATVAHSGTQSIAIDPPVPGKKRRRRQSEVRVMLYNVYERDHRLRVWLRAAQPMTVDVQVRALFPANWKSPAVQVLLGTIPGAAAVPEESDLPSFQLAAELDPEWRAFDIDVPFTGVPVEGYELNIDRRPGDTGVYWVDDVTFATTWASAAASR